MDKRTPSLRGKVLGADTTGPAVARVGTIQLNLVSSVTVQNVTNLPFGGRKAVFACWCWTPAESNGKLYSSKVSASAGRWRLPLFKLGQPERWRPSRRPAEAGNQGDDRGDRPPRLGVDVVTFEDMHEFLVAYSEYEQQMHITNQDGRDRVLARRRELVDLATKMMVAD